MLSYTLEPSQIFLDVQSFVNITSESNSGNQSENSMIMYYTFDIPVTRVTKGASAGTVNTIRFCEYTNHDYRAIMLIIHILLQIPSTNQALKMLIIMILL